MKFDADLVIIGAGSAGLSFAAGAVQMGAGVVLIEGGKMGGDCLNTGCVPSKALIEAARRAKGAASAKNLGVSCHDVTVDYASVMHHVRETIAAIEPHDSQERFEGLGVRVIRGYAEFASKNSIRVGNETVTARRIVVATGATPIAPPINGLDTVAYFTNETFFENRNRPDHLIIIGGGPIGVEMAQAHAQLGIKTTLIESFEILPREIAKTREIVRTKLLQDGVTVFENCDVRSIKENGAIKSITLGDGQMVKGSHILVATGRRANVQGLNLSAAGIETTDVGIKVDDSLRTTNRAVYAIGDVIGQEQFTHLAGYHASLVVRSALFGLPAKVRKNHIPRVTYCDPEVASVGDISDGTGIETYRVTYDGLDRAIAGARTDGFAQIWVKNGRVRGATIVGAQAGELIHFWSLVIAQNLKLSKASSVITPYPTLSDINKKLIGAYFTPRLFDNPKIKSFVKLIQRWVP
ncbi:MAG: dihydrolipoyl dehydrogenase family protein [Paracoccaceae bacterium]|jgi:pyruvate/2-oxoglutarate dehydrogenase complex dihydrolipoamide dehydrogenase (E3) component